MEQRPTAPHLGIYAKLSFYTYHRGGHWAIATEPWVSGGTDRAMQITTGRTNDVMTYTRWR
eukprot:SAG11_NODE_1411_length_4995_cov_21.158088_6_plen_61_part_00